MGAMTEDWARLGNAVMKRRKALRMTQEALAEAASVSRATIQSLERVRSQGMSRKTMGLIEDALGWMPGSMADLLRGGDPTLQSEEEPYRAEPMSDGDLVTVLHHVVYDLIAYTAPDTPLSRVRELEDRALRVAREVGLKGPRRRTPPNVDNDPEP